MGKAVSLHQNQSRFYRFVFWVIVCFKYNKGTTDAISDVPYSFMYADLLLLNELHRLDAALSIGIAGYVAVATLWRDDRLTGQIVE